MRLAPSSLLVFPLVVTVKVGLNSRVAQLAAWKGSLTVTGMSLEGSLKLAPDPITLEVNVVGVQLVGFSAKLGRSM